jgi:hypothetical protein
VHSEEDHREFITINEKQGHNFSVNFLAKNFVIGNVTYEFFKVLLPESL